MAYYAKVVSGVVVKVIVAEPAFFDMFIDDSPGTWVETFDDGYARKNYAGVGHTYDVEKDAFIGPKPFPSWVLDETTCKWKSPINKPIGAFLCWNEELQEWYSLA